MNKKIAIICLIVLACCAIGTVGYLVLKKRGNSADGTNDEMQIFSNQDNSYVLKLDNYVKFRETTAISNVNNKDGLEVNYGDNYITIQRFEYTTYNDNFSEFASLFKRRHLQNGVYRFAFGSVDKAAGVNDDGIGTVRLWNESVARFAQKI